MAGESFHHASTTTSYIPISGVSNIPIRGDPPIRLMAGEAGFLPLAPCTLLADISSYREI
jgi:hypothetical protein